MDEHNNTQNCNYCTTLVNIPKMMLQNDFKKKNQSLSSAIVTKSCWYFHGALA